MIEKLRRIAESLGYPFFFGTRDEVYAYINSVRTVVACYRQGGGGRQRFFVFKFKGDKPQRMYEEVMREIKRQFTVCVQRVFFYDDVLEARFPLMAKTYTEGGARPTPPPPPVGNNYMYFEAVEANSTVSLTSMLATAPNLEYSTDGETWQEWENTYNPESMFGPAYVFDIITLTDVGDRIYLRGVNLNGLANMEMEQFSIFVLSGKLGAYGSPMSLIDGTGSSTVVPDSGFMELFSGYFAEETLIHLPDMSKITQIGKNGCAAMFCANALITDAEDMPLLTRIDEGGCENMYRSATSLVVPANLGTNMQLGEDSLSRMYLSCDQIDLVENDQLTFSFNQLPTAYGSSTLADAAAVVHEMTYE